MAVMDPNQYEGPKGRGGGNFLDRAGTYLLAITSLKERSTNRNGTPYVKVTIEVIAGEPAGQGGKVFSDRMFLTDASMKVLANLCRSMGWTKPWDPSSDKQFRHVMLNRPFKANVTTKRGDKAVFCSLGFPKPRAELTDKEYQKMDAWVASRLESGDMMELEDELPPADDIRSDEYSDGGSDYDDPPPPTDDDYQEAPNKRQLGDDDIPF